MSKSLIVVDDLKLWSPYYPSSMVVSFADYLNMKGEAMDQTKRVINLCNAEKYLGHGYYCSLLAEARGHRVLPTVNAINDLKSRQLYLMQFGELKLLKLPPPADSEARSLVFKIFFGWCRNEAIKPMARKIFERVNFPILEVTLTYKESWMLKQLKTESIDSLTEQEQTEFAEALDKFSRVVWKKGRKQKHSRWDMGILVNPEEKMPPSDEKALQKMTKAAQKLGIEVELLTSKDYNRIGEYDALFIRETTEINHHTYRFSRRAELEGLVVMDDPISILRCCNKIYLTDAFRRNRIPTLRSTVIQNKDKGVVANLEAEFTYPIILKIPNGSFSRGVHKVNNRQELKDKLKELFQDSSLLLAQEYLYTDFDWRIGVLNNKPLFANRYYMAKDHWQIYQHVQNGTHEGSFDSLPTFEVPKVVLDAAIRSAQVIGDGFYGIDIKQQGSSAYVIEVNDNPNVDSGVEDAFIGDELYMQIMGEFARRLENRGR
jgi:glutathione synthase/RimK-type ligase-like ATP-grasp enzyme